MPRPPPTPPPDPRRAVHALVDQLLDILWAPPPAPVIEDSILPLLTAAQRLGWSQRRLRKFCLDRNVPVMGRGQVAAVDLRAVRAALSSQPRIDRRTEEQIRMDDIKASFDGGP
ncbi:MAG: hypothetical protein IPF99_24260 [Deltaproteobacteria bacterium]|nr:hypothetical protein [Deltaproteobacteria bacterium]